MPLEYGQIVLAHVSDGHFKARPVVMLTPTNAILPSEPIEVACVSTHIERPMPPHHIPLPWHRGRHPRTGLDKPNVVKCDWLARIDQTEIIRAWGLFRARR
jgi:hypothetical protein